MNNLILEEVLLDSKKILDIYRAKDKSYFIFDEFPSNEKAKKIIENRYDFYDKKMESRTDAFYCMYKKSIEETMKIFNRGSFTTDEWKKYCEDYGIELKKHQIKERVELVTTTKILDPIKMRSFKYDVVGTRPSVPRTILNLPNSMRRKAKNDKNAWDEREVDGLQITINIGYPHWVNATDIIQTVYTLIKIIESLYGDEKLINVKILRAVKLGDKITYWTWQKIDGAGSIYDFLHYFTPMYFRGLEFIWQWNLECMINDEKLGQIFKNKSMGDVLLNESQKVIFNLQDVYNENPNLKNNFQEVIESDGDIKIDLLFIDIWKVSEKYNNLFNDTDINDFTFDLNNEVTKYIEKIKLTKGEN